MFYVNDGLKFKCPALSFKGQYFYIRQTFDTIFLSSGTAHVLT